MSGWLGLYVAFNPRPHFNEDGRTADRDLWPTHATASSPTIDTQVQGRFRTGPLRHVVLGGLDMQHATITGRQTWALQPAIDLYAPVYGNFTVPWSWKPTRSCGRRSASWRATPTRTRRCRRATTATPARGWR